jgi:hypothetical protein
VSKHTRYACILHSRPLTFTDLRLGVLRGMLLTCGQKHTMKQVRRLYASRLKVNKNSIALRCGRGVDENAELRTLASTDGVVVFIAQWRKVKKRVVENSKGDNAVLRGLDRDTKRKRDTVGDLKERCPKKRKKGQEELQTSAYLNHGQRAS